MPAVLSNQKNYVVAFMFSFQNNAKKYVFNNTAETVSS